MKISHTYLLYNSLRPKSNTVGANIVRPFSINALSYIDTIISAKKEYTFVLYR